MDFVEAANAALDKRAAAFAQLRAVQDDAALSAAERDERAARINGEIDALGVEAEQHVRSAEREAEHRALNERAAALATTAGGESRGGVSSEASHLRRLARGEVPAVDFDFRTATSSDPANAGNTAPPTFVAMVLEAMRERSQFFSRARVLTTDGGENLEWPVKNAMNPATPVVSGATRITENTAYPKGDQSWGKAVIGAHKYGVIVEATTEIVADSALPILSILASDAGEAVADAALTDLMIGDGTNKPWGWFTRASGAVNAADLNSVTFDNLMDLQYAVTAPYRRTGVYMFNDLAVSVLRKVKDADGRYLWQPSLTAGEPDAMLGKPVLTDPNIAIAGAGAKVGVFGDPFKYLIRQVRTLRVIRSDEFGYDRDVVAFKVTWRGSGDLLDVNSVKALTVTA
ncbi:phage major capsid protein [Micromonospora sp. WMMA1363]|uniref:phage major capsid protein n=1 Tax=Micromonospora sp. WMMA1363 TaxID=3053985 RepID=UPI00259CF737|nr:phage major capsid protein [Micromonospora sp. WMMA1363]MDM4718462.1 phage major capsid protein [Micromonospora sp. WMMA1363]